MDPPHPHRYHSCNPDHRDRRGRREQAARGPGQGGSGGLGQDARPVHQVRRGEPPGARAPRAASAAHVGNF